MRDRTLDAAIALIVVGVLLWTGSQLLLPSVGQPIPWLLVLTVLIVAATAIWVLTALKT